jgi:hypothetical protein
MLKFNEYMNENLTNKQFKKGQVVNIDWDGSSTVIIQSIDGDTIHINRINKRNGEPSDKEEDNLYVSHDELNNMFLKRENEIEKWRKTKQDINKKWDEYHKNIDNKYMSLTIDELQDMITKNNTEIERLRKYVSKMGYAIASNSLDKIDDLEKENMKIYSYISKKHE